MKRLLLAFLFLSTAAFGINGGPENQYHIVKDFHQDWYVYDSENSFFKPELDLSSTSNQAHTAFIDLSKYSSFTLLVQSQKTPGLLLINGEVYQKLKAGEWLTIPISSIAPSKDEISISIYGDYNLANKKVLIGSKINQGQVSSGIDRNGLIAMKSRIPRNFGNSYILILGLIILYTTVLSSSNPKAFGEYFSFSDLFVTKVRDTKFLISKPLNRVNQAFLILLSLTSGLLFVLIAGNGLYLFNNPFSLSSESGTLGYITVFMIVSVISFAFYLGKYILLNIMSQLFGIKKTLNIHYFKNIQFTLLVFLIMVLGFYAWSVRLKPLESFDPNIVYWILLICYLVRSILSYLSILKSTGVQSLYLIAYLCVVEMLPIMIGLKLAF